MKQRSITLLFALILCLTLLSPNAQAAVAVSVDKAVYVPKETVVVSYSGVTATDVSNRAWIALAKAGAPANSYSNWKAVEKGDGTIRWPAPSSSGTYEIRYYKASSANEKNLVESKTVTFTVSVSEAGKGVALSIPKTVYMPKEEITVSYTGVSGAAVSVNTYTAMSQQTVEPYSPNPFSDTEETDVLRAYNAQLTGGTGDGKFSPNDKLTREEGATMLARAYKHTVYSNYTLATDSEFPLEYSRPAFFADDGDISTWSYASVNFMFENNTINGVGDNRFGPRITMTREQAPLIAARMVDNLDVGG